MSDFLSFRRMIVPIIIQIIFWVGVAFSVIVGIVMLVGGEEVWERLMGVGWIIFGPLLVRIYCEFIIVLFRINETLTEIKNALKK